MSRFPALLMATCLVSAPAPAAGSEAAAACLFDRLGAEDRVLLGEYALGGQSAPAGLDARLAAHARACGESLSLTAEQLDQAGVALIARLVLERTRVRLEVAGIPADALDAWFDAQSDPVRSRYGGAEMSDDDVAALTRSMVAALESRGVAASRLREQADLVGSYLNTRSLQFRMQHEISRP